MNKEIKEKEMDTETAIKILNRRLKHLKARIDFQKGSEQALSFDMREHEALEFVIAKIQPPKMAKEVPTQKQQQETV